MSTIFFLFTVISHSSSGTSSGWHPSKIWTPGYAPDSTMLQNNATVVHHQPEVGLKGKAREGNRGWPEDRSERKQNKISPSKESGEGLHRLSLGSEDLPQVSVSSPSPSVIQVRWHSQFSHQCHKTETASYGGVKC